MTPNQRMVERYMEGFRRSDREMVLSCLADDVQWEIPGMFHTRGKEEFGSHIVDEGFLPNPEIIVTRMIEEGGVVVAEGRVRPRRTDGTVLHLAFCDVFEMQDGRIRKLTSYFMESR